MKLNAMVASALCAALTSVPAAAAEGVWTEGFGQGNLEYFIDKDGYRLYIGCPTPDGSSGSPSSVTVQNLRTNRDASKFVLEVGGISFDGPFQADSRVGDQNFLAAMERLRKGDAVLHVERRVIKLPRANAERVIPPYGKNLRCNLS